MRKQVIPYLNIAPIESTAIQFVSSVGHISDQQGQISYSVLHIAMDKDKSCTNNCDFPVYIGANQVINTDQYAEMLRQFRDNQPFVAVEIKNLRVVRVTDDNGAFSYYGTADNFQTIDIDEAKSRLEDLL